MQKKATPMLMRSVLTVLLFFSFVAAGERSVFAAEIAPATAPQDPENTLYLDLDYGRVVIRMRPDLAPKHVERIKHLVRGGFYDGMVFHRVLAGFMAQTGDPKGNGTGGSGRTLPAEFTSTPQTRGTVSMARTSDKDSGDSQFFIVLADSRAALDGKYTVWGQVVSGMDFVDMIRKGDAGRDGKVNNPDRLARAQIAADADRSAPVVVNTDTLKTIAGAAIARNFTGAEFRCQTLLSSSGVSVQAALAPVWVHGYLAGAYKAQKKLTFAGEVAGDAFDGALLAACKSFPAAFLVDLTAQTLAKTPRDLPRVTSAFPADSYTCKQYGAARAATAPEADLADMWVFAFIQGYKNVGQPGLEMPFDIKTQLLTTIANACVKTPDATLIDYAELMATKVKLK